MHLAVEMLVHAQRGNFDTALLVAGDEDYVRLVDEVKRCGALVFGAFFSASGMSTSLRRSLDGFEDLQEVLDKHLKTEVDRFKAGLPAPTKLSRTDRRERLEALGALADEYRGQDPTSTGRAESLKSAALVLADLFGDSVRLDLDR